MSDLGVLGLDHCTVLITDVPAARAFYGVALGLEEIPAPAAFDFVALWYRLGPSYLHLLLKPEPDTPGPRHFCVRVADIGAARARLGEAGVAVTETVVIPGAGRFFVRDPFGNRIEFLQWERPYDPAADGRFSA